MAPGVRAIAAACLLLAPSAARAGVGSDDTYALLAKACRLLQAKTRSTVLLRRLGAADPWNGIQGWAGDLPGSRFTTVAALGDYDEEAVPDSLEFVVAEWFDVSKSESRTLAIALAQLEGVQCELLRFGRKKPRGFSGPERLCLRLHQLEPEPSHHEPPSPRCPDPRTR